MSVALVEYSLQALVCEVVQSFSALASAKNLQLYMCLSPDLPERLVGGAGHIRIILENLLSNAIRFTSNGRVVLRVNSVKRDGHSSNLHWQVSDTGIGIDPQRHQKLFASLKNDTTPRTLRGLPLCQQLANNLGGDLRLVSEVGLGSSFTLSVPLETPAAPVGSDIHGKLLPHTVYVVSSARELAQSVCGWLRRWGARAQVGRPPVTAEFGGQLLLELHPDCSEQPWVRDWAGPLVIASTDTRGGQPNINDLQAIRHAVRQAQMSCSSIGNGVHFARPERELNLHILVVESNRFNQSLLCDQLRVLGCTLTLCTDGAAALEKWSSAVFDAVLTQVSSLHINGYELATELRRRGCDKLIIGIKANGTRHDAGLCLAHGMDDCLAQPLILSSLFRCLATLKKGNT
ncbi:CheY-like chemotaxis protein [Pseudomonas hunanensis]|nr:CheY-like chemotaxis protein [Pseudomonas hunanensis]